MPMRFQVMWKILVLGLLVTAACAQPAPQQKQASPAASEAAPSPPTNSAPKKEYVFRGKVESVDPKAGMVNVANEAIDGWMGAMTMLYRVDNKEIVEQLKP